MKTHEFHNAIVSQMRGRSWHDARVEVAAGLSLAEAGALLDEARSHEFDARWTTIEKLSALGAARIDYARLIEVRLAAWWRVTPEGWVEFCPDDAPSTDPQDWLSPDTIDSAAPEAERVQTLADDVTLVLTDGMGAVVYTTSRRVAYAVLSRATGAAVVRVAAEGATE